MYVLDSKRLLDKLDIVVDRHRVDQTRIRLAEADVGDETGMVTLRTPRDDHITLLQECMSSAAASCNEDSSSISQKPSIVIRNCSVELFRNTHLRIAVSKWGKITPYPDGIASTPNPPKKLNKEIHLSNIDFAGITEMQLDKQNNQINFEHGDESTSPASEIDYPRSKQSMRKNSQKQHHRQHFKGSLSSPLSSMKKKQSQKYRGQTNQAFMRDSDIEMRNYYASQYQPHPHLVSQYPYSPHYYQHSYAENLQSVHPNQSLGFDPNFIAQSQVGGTEPFPSFHYPNEALGGRSVPTHQVRDFHQPEATHNFGQSPQKLKAPIKSYQAHSKESLSDNTTPDRYQDVTDSSPPNTSATSDTTNAHDNSRSISPEQRSHEGSHQQNSESASRPSTQTSSLSGYFQTLRVKEQQRARPTSPFSQASYASLNQMDPTALSFIPGHGWGPNRQSKFIAKIKILTLFCVRPQFRFYV